MKEVAIIGAGPIGIELAVALKQRGIEYVHLEARQVGATMFWWPPGTRWFSSNDRISIAGVPLQTVDQSKCTREEYLRYLRGIVEQFDLSINTYEPVASVERIDGGFRLATRPLRGRQVYEARRVVLATGGTAAARRIGVEGEDLPHVSHYMEDPHKYFRKRVLVVGGKNSAVEAALRLQQVGAEVSLSYRRAELDREAIKYWLYPEISGLLKSGRIRGHFHTIVTRIAPEKVVLNPCYGESFVAQPDTSVEVLADFVLLLVGYVADMSLARMAGVELRGANEAPVFDEQTMETNVPGVYMAGTAVGGTQSRFRIFLENCHIHVERIIAVVMGERPPAGRVEVGAPES